MKPVAFGWIDHDSSAAPEWETAQVQRLARRLGYRLVWPEWAEMLPLTLANCGHPFDDVADRMGPGFRPAAANAAVRCGQNVGTRPHPRVLGA
ncbi:hypothetical protein ABZ511_18705 [Nocardia gamkensis]|uniref:hypothetical protein n=1 Tax=Nocardia gamkensis TaxID=352869 RepID=UPI0033F4487C